VASVTLVVRDTIAPHVMTPADPAGPAPPWPQRLFATRTLWVCGVCRFSFISNRNAARCPNDVIWKQSWEQ
jgi:hypothetical protein